MRVTEGLLALLVVAGLCGCQKTPEDVRTGIVANSDITDQEAIELLAQSIFKNLKSYSTRDENGEITLEVVVHLGDDGMVNTIDGGASPEDTDAGVALGITVFDGRKMIEFGAKRGLRNLAISVLHSALNDQEELVDVDIFKYSVSKDQFDNFLNTGSALEIAKGEAKRVIEATCVVEYDHFDKLEYQAVE